MRKLLAIGLLGITVLFAGCGVKNNNDEETTNETQVQKETEYPTESVADETRGGWVSFTYGDVQKYETINSVFMSDDVQTVYEDRLLTQKNSYATAEVKRIVADNDYSSRYNHSFTYSSEAGTVKDIKISHDTGNDLTLGANFYEADMNGDGYKELVVTFISAAGTGYSEGMYIYDFKNKKGTEVYGLTAKQEADVLKVFEQWYVKGFTEIMDINHGLINELNCSSFHPKAVMYNGKMALYVRFAPPFPCKWAGYGTGYSAMLVYKDGEYVVDKVWVEGEYRTDEKDSIDGAVIGTTTPFSN